MSTYTTSLGLEEITPGDQAGLWGDTTNNNLVLIDQAVTGVTPLSFAGASGTTVTLDGAVGTVNTARSAVINITGSATGSNTVIVPNKQKTYLVRNNTGQTVRFQTASPVEYYDVLAGNSILIFCDGNNNVFTGIKSPSAGTLTVPYGGTGKTSFTAGFVVSPGGGADLGTVSYIDLSTDVATTVLPVANGGTGLSTITSGAVLIGNGTGTVSPVTGGTAGYVLTWNGSSWAPAASAAAGVTSVSVTSPIVNTGSSTAPNIGISSTPSFTSVAASSGMTIGGVAVATTSNLSSYASLTTSSQQTFNGSIRCPQGIDTGSVGIGLFGQAMNFTTYTSFFYSAGQLQFSVSGSGFNAVLLLDSGAVYACKPVYPNSDNSWALGWAGGRWTVVYAVNGAIQTSDVTEKTEIADLDEVEKRVATRIKGLIKKYKWKDSVAEKGSANARIHVGVIAQEVGAAFEAEGLDPHRYGMFCYDEWEAKDEVLGKDGEVSSPAVSAGSRFGVRYDQLLAFVIAAL